VATLGGEQAYVDVETAPLLLGAVAAARVTDRLTHREIAPDADADVDVDEGRLARDAAVRPLTFTVALVVAAMMLSTATTQVSLHLDAWSRIVQHDGTDWFMGNWVLDFVSRPEPWLAAVAVIAHGPMRLATATTRVQCILITMSLPFVVQCAWGIPLVLSADMAGSMESFVPPFGAHGLLLAAVPASGLLLRRRHTILSPLDYVIIALTVAMAPVGLFLRGDVTGFGPGAGAPWGQVPWAATYVVPLVPVLLLHRLVGSRLRMRTIVIGAGVAGLVAAALSLAVIAVRKGVFPEPQAMDAFATLKITINWLASASCVSLARVLSRSEPPPGPAPQPSVVAPGVA